MMAPTPSPRTKPLAPASKALQRPRGDSIAMRRKAMKGSGLSSALTLATTASSHSPRHRLKAATWHAVNAEEQAVSVTRLGPRKSRQYEMRLAAMLKVEPVAE